MSASPAAAAAAVLPSRAWPIEVMLVDGTSLRFAMDPLPGLTGRPTACGIAKLVAATDLTWLTGHILSGPTGHETYAHHAIRRDAILWIDDIGFGHRGRKTWETALTGVPA